MSKIIIKTKSFLFTCKTKISDKKLQRFDIFFWVLYGYLTYLKLEVN